MALRWGYARGGTPRSQHEPQYRVINSDFGLICQRLRPCVRFFSYTHWTTWRAQQGSTDAPLTGPPRICHSFLERTILIATA